MNIKKLKFKWFGALSMKSGKYLAFLIVLPLMLHLGFQAISMLHKTIESLSNETTYTYETYGNYETMNEAQYVGKQSKIDTFQENEYADNITGKAVGDFLYAMGDIVE